jgi:hypothetical protein
MVFERPARIAYETRLYAGMTERDRYAVRRRYQAFARRMTTIDPRSCRHCA